MAMWTFQKITNKYICEELFYTFLKFWHQAKSWQKHVYLYFGDLKKRIFTIFFHNFALVV